MGKIEILDPSPFGVNLHNADELLPLFAGIGIRWFRVDVDWDAIETEPGRLGWFQTDRIVDTAEENGVSLLMSVAYTPTWASAPDRQSGVPPDRKRTLPPRDPELFVRFVHLVLERYGTRVQAVSVWNEPNFEQFWTGSLDEYLILLTSALREVRLTAPAMVTCGPDFSGWSKGSWLDFLSPKREREWMRRVLAATGCKTDSPMLDVITHHQYGGGDQPAGRIAIIEDLLQFLKENCRTVPPVWITETGFATDKVSLDAQGQHLRTTMEGMAARSSWWHKTFWYDSHGRQGRAEWGLLGPDGSSDAREPRTAFHTYATAIRDAGGTLPMSRALALRAVDLAYLSILGRDSDPEGRASHGRLVQTRSLEAACDSLLRSDEFAERQRALPPEETAAQFFSVARGHEATGDERSALLSALGDGRAAAIVAPIIKAATRTS